MPRLGQKLQCLDLVLVLGFIASVSPQSCGSSCSEWNFCRYFFQRLLLLWSFNHDISFKLFKLWDSATFIRNSYFELQAEMPRHIGFAMDQLADASVLRVSTSFLAEKPHTQNTSLSPWEEPLLEMWWSAHVFIKNFTRSLAVAVKNIQHLVGQLINILFLDDFVVIANVRFFAAYTDTQPFYCSSGR